MSRSIKTTMTARLSDTAGARKDAHVLTPVPAEASENRPEFLSPTPGHVAAVLAPVAVRPNALDRRSSAPLTNARPFGSPDDELPFSSAMRSPLIYDESSEPPVGMQSVRALTPHQPVVSMPSEPARRDDGIRRISPLPPSGSLDAFRTPRPGLVEPAPRWTQPSQLPSTPRPPLATQHAGARPAQGDVRRVDALSQERDGIARLAEAVSSRFTGSLTFETSDGARCVVFRDGDFVTVAPANEAESLVAFLVARGEVPRDAVMRLSARLAAGGRHAGAALVAHGLLGQDELWTTLRSHAEWLLGLLLPLAAGTVIATEDVPPRLRAEPSVFGGSAGAEVLVEVTRRFVPPEAAVRAMGGSRARIGDGQSPRLLSECALSSSEAELAERARGFTVGEVLQAAHQPDYASVLLALVRLGVFATLAPAGGASLAPPPPQDPLDEEALRSRIKARLALVDEGDYFSILGVPRTATPYEIRRAYTALRRAFEPSRVLSPTTTDLAESLKLILEVLDEAFEILRDPTRRERYRRAIESPPG
ncbi:MAG: DnaJ domain-containing protein [Polyangiaceae bacterium]